MGMWGYGHYTQEQLHKNVLNILDSDDPVDVIAAADYMLDNYYKYSGFMFNKARARLKSIPIDWFETWGHPRMVMEIVLELSRKLASAAKQAEISGEA